MVKGLTIFAMLLANGLCGRNVILKTAKEQYLATVKKINSIDKPKRNGSDYQNEPDWINKCSLKSGKDYTGRCDSLKEGPMVQEDVLGGGRIEMRCRGGCLKILKLLYSCKESDVSNPDQLCRVQERCEDKDSCDVSATRTMFGSTECPASPDKDMKMWVVYQCNGGEDDTRLIGPKTRTTTTTQRPTTRRGNVIEPSTTQNPYVIEPETCSGKKGRKKGMTVPGCEGRLEMKCPNGCLKIMDAQYYCGSTKTGTTEDIKIVQNLCEDKARCRVPASRGIFGSSVCPNTDSKDMKLRIKYRCDGGHDKTRLRAPKGRFCEKLQTTTTTQPPTTTTTIKTTTTTTGPATPPPKCSNPNKGRHTTKTIALDGEHIKMMCNGRGGGDRPCISIHKVLLGCTGGGRENPAHKQLVDNMCGGKTQCRIDPTSRMFNTYCRGKRMLWLTYSCDGGTDGSMVVQPSQWRGCFAPSSYVETRGGLKSIPELRIGDMIRTSFNNRHTDFTEFLGWLDRQGSSPVEMLKIFTSDDSKAVTLSASHVVFTSNSTKYAGDLVPGDTLLHWTGVEMEEMEIAEIRTSLESGYWAPMTRDGTLLVNGFLMSCYASYPHQLSDLSMLPAKLMPRVLLDDKESQHKDGVRSLVKVLKQVGKMIGVARQEETNNQGLPTLQFGHDRVFDDSLTRKYEL